MLDVSGLEYISSAGLRVILSLKKRCGGKPFRIAEGICPDAKWLRPLAWFRACANMLKGDRWGEAMRKRALGFLREDLIPFVRREEEAQKKAY